MKYMLPLAGWLLLAGLPSALAADAGLWRSQAPPAGRCCRWISRPKARPKD